MRALISPLTVVLLASLVGTIQAQSFRASVPPGLFTAAMTGSVAVATVPQGIVTYSLPAVNQSQISTSYFSLPLTSAPVYTGTVSALSAVASGSTNTIAVSDPTPPFTNSLASLATPAQPYFVKFLSGAETGRVIRVTANTSSTLTLDITDNSSQTTALNTSGFAVTAGAAGDSFAVFPGDTLATLFGSSASQLTANGLQGSSFSGHADSISIYSTAQIAFLSYYFDTTAGFWKQTGSTLNANNTILYPFSAFTISRRGYDSTGAAAARAMSSYALSGSVPEVNLLTETPGGGVIYGSTLYPVDQTLSQLQFGPNFIANTFSGNADTLSIWDPNLIKYDTYYQVPPTGTQTMATWREVGFPSTDVSTSVTIPAGTLVGILKRAPVSGSASFLQSSMPYSVGP